jgi:hypothetical protein
MGVWSDYVVEAIARIGGHPGYRSIVVTTGGDSNADDNCHLFVNTTPQRAPTAATARNVTAALA